MRNLAIAALLVALVPSLVSGAPLLPPSCNHGSWEGRLSISKELQESHIAIYITDSDKAPHYQVSIEDDGSSGFAIMLADDREMTNKILLRVDKEEVQEIDVKWDHYPNLNIGGNSRGTFIKLDNVVLDKMKQGSYLYISMSEPGGFAYIVNRLSLNGITAALKCGN